MADFPPDVLESLIRHDSRSFEHALGSLQDQFGDASEEQVLRNIVKILTGLNGTECLGPLERSRRTTLVLKTALLTQPFLERLAGEARSWRTEVKIAVAGYLPERQKRAVYGRAMPSPALPPALERGSEQAAGTTCAPAAAVPVPVVREVPRYRTVLLLGTHDDHEANLRSLDHHKLDPLRVDRPESLDRLLDETVCAVVVAKSWWTAIPGADHRNSLQKLLSHSSFTWVKMDHTGFVAGDGPPLQDLYKAVRFTDPHQFVCGDGCRISDYDVENFRRASDLISTPLTAYLAPGEVQSEEANLLLAATARCVQARHFTTPVTVERVPIALVAGGQSLAKIFRLEPDDGGAPFIAKIDEIPSLQDEMERFCRFIEPWDSSLKPCLHFHTGRGAIVFTLVDRPGIPGQPAPTLEERIEAALYSELRAPVAEDQREQNLATALTRAVNKLKDLNRRPCPSGSLPSRQWLKLDGLATMLNRGICWKIRAFQDTSKDALAVRHEALAYVDRLREKATTHGDSHLRNILIRDDREPFFIDYALSGPGHPCFDLVRLESAIFFRCLRPTGDEHSVAELIHTLAQPEAKESDIHARFPSLVTSIGNRLAIKASILCRNAALEVLQGYRGSIADHLAVKYVIACQSLTLPLLQTGVVRAAVSALAPCLERITKFERR